MSFILRFCVSLTFVRLNQGSNSDMLADYARVVIAEVARAATNVA